MRKITCAIAAVSLFCAGGAASADDDKLTAEQAGTRDIVVDLGVGAQVQPKFASSDDYIVLPYPLIAISYLRLPVFGELVSAPTRAFSIYPSINFVGSRSSSDASYLTGMDDVDFAFEFGPGVAYRYGMFRGFANLRYGFTGHNGFVGEAGVDLVLNPMERVQLSLGPRVGFANDEYVQTYFGVSAAEATRSQFAAYDPSGGFTDVGVGGRITYDWTEKTKLHLQADYTRYIGDVADSPVVEAGSEDQFYVGIGITYRFGLDLFD
ncbi:MipA/OmpV family protein [Amorphus orientalis]|uniref:Outer membrane scaffolding protein for murein synthesis (MipA/OmpV family) n=1 Tax=Amorphus orientalis TaxID=649198 RepID=A0AAE4ATF8_9HYPH|nr:MipA/OmpV family protein [Amorphus orientalis]MDQ0316110.1 outer membrane scaffolding protein for murein synthesis (MipA/OmpV family) [Amorphus orientalis]